MKVGGVHHVAIKAADVERVAAFYRDILGLPVVAQNLDATGALRSIWVRAEATIVMIERGGVARGGPPPDPPPTLATRFQADAPGIHLVAFAMVASDRGRWRAHLEAGGHPIVHETAYSIYVLDPEGNRVALSSHPDVG